MIREFLHKLKIFFWPNRKNNYKPHFLESRFILAYAFFLLFLKLAILPFLFYFPDTAFFADLTKINLIELTNTARQECGFEPLAENSRLNQAAYLKAKDMIEQGYFSHCSPEGVEPWYWLELSDYKYSSAGENLAIGFLESEQVHDAWMDSPSHQKNILNPYYKEIGISVVKGDFQGKEVALVVQFFGTAPRSFSDNNSTVNSVPQDVQEPIAGTETEEVVEVFSEEESTEVSLEEEASGICLEEEIAESERENFEKLAEVVALDKGEVIAAATGEESRQTPLFLLFQFMTGKYYGLVQTIVYGFLGLIIFCLFITVFYDIFIYRCFEIQYWGVLLKSFGFSALWLVLVFLDKIMMIELVNPGNFMVF